mgnify:CR=1 FL=1
MSQEKVKCVYPKCFKNQISYQSVNGLCPYHTQILEFYIWSLSNIVITAPKIVEK